MKHGLNTDQKSRTLISVFHPCLNFLLKFKEESPP